VNPFRCCSWNSIRARRPSAATACFAIGSLNVVYSSPSSSRRTKRVFGLRLERLHLADDDLLGHGRLVPVKRALENGYELDDDPGRLDRDVPEPRRLGLAGR
jgi:hypothetical protein